MNTKLDSIKIDRPETKDADGKVKKGKSADIVIKKK